MTAPAWFRVILPPHESTGGIAQTMYCRVCGAAVVVTLDDTMPAALHTEWHELAGEAPPDEAVLP